MGVKKVNLWNPLIFVKPEPEDLIPPSEFRQEGHTLDEIEGAVEFDASLLEC